MASRSRAPYAVLATLFALSVLFQIKVASDLVARLAEQPAAVWFSQGVPQLLIPIFCLALGFWVGGARPRDPMAWLLLALMLSFAHQVVPLNERTWLEWLRKPAAIFHLGLGQAWPLWMLLFGLYFPRPFPFERRMPWLKWIVIAPLVAIHATQIVIVSAGLRDFLTPYGTPILIFRMMAISIFFMSLGFRSGTETDPDSRRRLRLLMYGVMIAMTPQFILIIVRLVQRRNPFNAENWIGVVAYAMMALFPVAMAYVIVVHRAMDVRVALRQGVQYSLARGGVRILRAAVVIAIIALAVSLYQSRASWYEQAVIGGVAAGLIYFVRLRSDRFAIAVDRRFFREAYQTDQILNDLGQSVRTILEEKPLLETVARRISESLHVPRVALLLGHNGAYRPAYALGYDPDPAVTIPGDSVTVERVRADKSPPRVYFDDEQSWVHTGSQAETEALKTLDSQLLLPLQTKDQLLGIVSLGPKRSEEPYSPSDVRLLQSVAAQTGMALENSRLSAAIAREVAHRERLNREIEIAREVQERLFPQELPEIHGVDYAGHCRPALGVGGDYYDFLALAGGGLGIAVGDVSGKGIAAALLMASLQASLRGQTIQEGGDLAKVMGNVNRLVFDASQSNRYATFFYAQYDPPTRRLTYVNGGHNPPVILRRRAGGTEVIRLEAGGPVVGLFRPAVFEQGALEMQPGDILIGFTDGISEAMNRDDEEWGEERLIPAIDACAERSASEMIPVLMAAADAFVDGAPQHDDMTLVVVKVA